MTKDFQAAVMIPNHIMKPLRLKEGDTVGVVAPASPFDMEEFENGIKSIESMGFRAAVPEELFERSGFLAGSDSHRAHLVQRFFADPKLRGIICARGGYGSVRILSLLDFKRLQQDPKVFVGFSDISVLLNTLFARSGLVTIHGPMITALGRAEKLGRDSLQGAIAGDRPVVLRAPEGIVLAPGRATGRVAGGNLTALCHLVGTPFTPDFGQNLLFLEDVGEAPYRIDRMLVQMKIAGCFHGIVGVVLGSFIDCGDVEEIHRIFSEIFQDTGVPILAGIPAGHGEENLSFPIGLEATLDTDAMELRYHEPATSV